MGTGILVCSFISYSGGRALLLTFCLTHGVHSRYLSNVAVFNKGIPQNTKNSHRFGGFSVSHC
jgi:hypothetical protein